MRINDYLQEIESLIRSCPFVVSYNLNFEKKTQDVVYISGRLDFRNGTVLDFKEFLEESIAGLEKFKYGYNYRKKSNILFRYG